MKNSSKDHRFMNSWKRLHFRDVFFVKARLLTFLLKCEVFREMTAFVVASEKKQCVWVAQLKCPQVQYALQQRRDKLSF